MVVIVPAGHELAGAGAIDREALAGLPFVSLHRSSTVAAIRAELESHGIDWQHLRVIMARACSACFAGNPCFHVGSDSNRAAALCMHISSR